MVARTDRGNTTVTPDDTRVSALESQVAALLAERGIPADPIAAIKKNLADHLAVRAAMAPSVDFTHSRKTVDELPDNPTSAHTAALLHSVTRHKHTEPDMSYVHHLAEELHQTILDNEATSRGAEATSRGADETQTAENDD